MHWTRRGSFLFAAFFTLHLFAETPPLERREVKDAAKVEDAIKKGAGVKDRNAQGFTWLHYAARAGTPEVVKLLITRGAEVNAADPAGWTPIFMAGSGAIASTLIANGADVNFQDKQGRTPAHALLPLDRKESKEQIQLSLDVLSVLVKAKGYDPVRREKDGQAALEWALLQKNLQHAKIMLKAGFNLATYKNTNGMTMLEHFVTFSESDVVKFLLENGANANIKTKHGMPLLHFAAMNGNAEAVSLLLDHGADVNAKDAGGQTAISVAQDPEVKSLLKKKGAKE